MKLDDAFLAVMRSPDIPRRWNPGKRPAGTTLKVSRPSDPCFLVEIDLPAVVSERAAWRGGWARRREDRPATGGADSVPSSRL